MQDARCWMLDTGSEKI